MLPDIHKELRALTCSELYQRLVDHRDMVEEILHAFQITTRVGALGLDNAGMTYRSADGRYYIIANQILEFEQQELVFFHELYHIVVEAPQATRFLRMDYTEEEHAADAVAEVAAGWEQASRADEEWLV